MQRIGKEARGNEMTGTPQRRKSSFHTGGATLVVRTLKCDCSEHEEAVIDSWPAFESFKVFFADKVKSASFLQIPVKKPYHIGFDSMAIMLWFADEWYRCVTCGALWEFVHPEFPAHGRVTVSFAGGNDDGYVGSMQKSCSVPYSDALKRCLNEAVLMRRRNATESDIKEKIHEYTSDGLIVDALCV
jgi:hypothetical protein